MTQETTRTKSTVSFVKSRNGSPQELNSASKNNQIVLLIKFKWQCPGKQLFICSDCLNRYAVVHYLLIKSISSLLNKPYKVLPFHLNTHI